VKSLISTLEENFNDLEEKLILLFNNLEIIYQSNHQGNIYVVGRPEYYYKELSTEEEKKQIFFDRIYKKITEQTDRLIECTPNKIQENYSEVKKEFELWLYLDRNYSITGSKEQNIVKFKKCTNKFKKILCLFKNDEEIILVPDTNALLIEQDPNEYKKLIDADIFTFILLPTVISELDDLKEKNPDSSRKEKAKKMIKRIKGWKTQGKITEGITLNKTIRLKVEVGEPLDNNLPKWLHLSKNDDKILAYILNIQLKSPSAIIILVTRDINMQNKAETLNIEYIDIDLKEQK